jgi:4-hydroxy-tetrahydrodipicolinate reductase
VDVMVDFSLPQATLEIAGWCRESGVPLVVGTTGFDATRRAALESAADRIPLLISPNMSRAVNLLMRLVGEAARVLGPAADIEIIERHHRTKKDAPSGTALRLAEVAGRGAAAGRLVSGHPESPEVRSPGEIGIHALRIADSPGEHTVVFGLMGETLELTHRALNRDGFARGALEAAKFLAGKPAGLYSMDDVLASLGDGRP